MFFVIDSSIEKGPKWPKRMQEMNNIFIEWSEARLEKRTIGLIIIVYASNNVYTIYIL